MNRTCTPQAVAWALATLCATLALGAQAQPQPARPDAAAQADPPGDRLPAVTITGTALRRIDAETALPVIVLHRADIERAGARTTTELLQQLPVMQGMVQTTSVVGNDSRGYASVSIHDLGDAYTLVLLNGQRLAPFGGQLSNGALSGVDINTVPLAMIDRIEVLTDGASAVYGADALGGVVNIITRRGDEANEATLGVSWPRGGAREWRASAFKSVGGLEETGQALSVGLSALRRTALRATEREGAHDAIVDFHHQGRRYQLADAQLTSAPANIFDSGFLGNPALQATGACPSGSRAYALPGLAAYPFCAYNYVADLDLVPEQAQHSAMLGYTRQFAPGSTLQLDALWSRSVVRSHLAPAGLTDYLAVPASSPAYTNYLSGLGVLDDPTYLLYRFVDLGRRGFEDRSDLAHLAARLEGRLHGWAWTTGGAYSISQQRSDIDHALSQNAAQRLFDSGQLDPTAAPGGQTGSSLAALRAQSYSGHWLSGRSTLAELQWQATRDLQALPGGPLKWAVGANWRGERLSLQPGLFAQGLLSDLGAGTRAAPGDVGNLRLGDRVPIAPSTASRTAWGAFTELLAPLTPTLEWGGAVRADHDELAGEALTGKTSLRWRPSAALLWRGALGTGFRVPTLNQLRSPSRSDGVTQGSYLCTEALQQQAVALGAAPCTLGTEQTYPVLLGGNAALRPEHSVQASLGMRIEPLSGHVLGLDLWAVQIRDRIGAVGETAAFYNPAAVPEAWTSVAGAGGSELALSGSPRNLGTLLSSGLDLEASVRRASPIGLVDSQLRGTVMLREDARLYPGGPWSSSIGDGQYGGATLKWRASWRTSLVRAGWTHSLTARYQSGFVDAPVAVQPLDASGQPAGDTESVRLKVSGQVLWDWQTNWQLNSAWQLSAGIVNLFDTAPPLSLNQVGRYKGQMLGYDERYFDVRGRLFVLEARLAF